MFTCAACLQRALQSLHQPCTIPTASRLRTRPNNLAARSPIQSLSLTRSHATVQSISQGHHRKRLIKLLAGKEDKPVLPNNRRNPAKPNPVEVRDRLARENNRKLLDRSPENSQLRRKAEFEAQFIVSDPLKLANAVAEKLREGDGAPRQYGDVEAALQLVRASERARQLARGVDGELIQLEKKGLIENVVSWNHIIDWLMEKGDTKQAQKIYNEMKKRGHRPDAHTYTIMLRGFGKNIKSPNAVKDAVGVFNSISAANSVVTPNTIHTNAIMNACAKGGDMDSLWAVVGRLPERGPGAPDKWTFTTILNAIQHDVTKRASHVIGSYGKDSTDRDLIFEEAVNDGRKIWRDVVHRWRKGDLKVDEQLTCAMGRLLLLSNRRKDILDVFELVQQTMNIEIPIAKVMDVDSTIGQLDEHESTPPEIASQLPNTENPRELSSVPATTTPSHQPGLVQSSIYAIPGNNALSMLIEAATVIREMQTGKAYWDILTSPDGLYKIAPDAQNIIAYLRILRISRSSKAALEILERNWPTEVARRLYTRGTFTIAMSTCVRDKNNRNVFATASKIIDLMEGKARVISYENDEDFEDEDEGEDDGKRRNLVNTRGQMLDLEPKVLTMYLGLAVATTKGLGSGSPLTRTQNGDFEFERDLDKNNTIRALKRLGPDVINIKRLLKAKVTETEFDDLPLSQRTERRKKKGFVDTPRVNERFDDLVGLLRGMHGAYDRILAVNETLESEGMGPLDSTFINECWSQKRSLTAFLAKTVSKDDQEQLKWQGKKTGLWEGYDPSSERNRGPSNRDNAFNEDDTNGNDEAEGFEMDNHLVRTPGSAKVKKMMKIEVNNQRRHQESLHLSRRQQREVEKERRLGRGRSQTSPMRSSQGVARRFNGRNVL